MGIEVTAGELAIAGAGGLLIGAVYFGGLWITIGRLPSARVPALLALGSFLLRSLLAAASFVWLAQGSWVRLLVCLAGFLVARLALARRWGPSAKAERNRELA